MVPRSPVTLRLLTDDAVPMFHRWLQRPHIAEWWGGEDQHLRLREVRAKYPPRIIGTDRVTPYIATLGAKPIGCAQSYVAFGCGSG